jgi:tetratricopeptide (TPR) repeat protein
MTGGRPAWFLGLLIVVSLFVAAIGLVGLSRSGDAFAKGSAAYGRGDWRGALEHARRILAATPADIRALRLSARSSARLGRTAESEALYLRLDVASLEAEDLCLLGSAFLRRGNMSAARALLERARATAPNHGETLDALAQLWTQTGEMLDAVTTARSLSQQSGWEVRGLVRLGRLRWDLLDPAGAAEALTEALARDPSLREAGGSPATTRKLLARSLLASGKPAEARGQLLVLSGPEHDHETSWLLSRALLQEGKTAEAEAALKLAQGFGERGPDAAEPARFVGSARCAECHRQQFRSQQSSRHARTLVRTQDLGTIPWTDRPIVERDDPRVEHRVRRNAAQVEIVTEVGGRAPRALVEYALGSNRQGQSFLARGEDGQMRVHRVSRYPAEPRWDRTVDHPGIPEEASGYLGRPLSPESVRRCLHCHATSFKAVQEPLGRPEAHDASIGCERCHGPGGNHLRAIALGFSEPAIGQVGSDPASHLIALCGQCHDGTPGATPDEPNFVRFQSRTFILSRCYIEGGGSFSCVTCHDPHQDVATSRTHYETKCLQCHPRAVQSDSPPHAHTERARAACPVSPRENCLDCHMPKVRDATPRTVFTDHGIRVHRERESSSRRIRKD